MKSTKPTVSDIISWVSLCEAFILIPVVSIPHPLPQSPPPPPPLNVAYGNCGQKVSKPSNNERKEESPSAQQMCLLLLL